MDKIHCPRCCTLLVALSNCPQWTNVQCPGCKVMGGLYPAPATGFERFVRATHLPGRLVYMTMVATAALGEADLIDLPGEIFGSAPLVGPEPLPALVLFLREGQQLPALPVPAPAPPPRLHRVGEPLPMICTCGHDQLNPVGSVWGMARRADQPLPPLPVACSQCKGHGYVIDVHLAPADEVEQALTSLAPAPQVKLSKSARRLLGPAAEWHGLPVQSTDFVRTDRHSITVPLALVMSSPGVSCPA